MKKRIYELSRELGMESKELLKLLSDLGLNLKSALNIIDEETEEIIKDLLKKEELPKSPPKIEIKEEKKEEVKQEKFEKKEKLITISGAITVRELAELLDISSTNLILKLMEMKIMANINQILEPDIIKKVGEKFGYKIEEIKTKGISKKRELTPEESERLKPRPPVVVVMGHVDHGKTTLLDAIRQTNVADREFGGITQHIGASVVEYQGKKIVFLDTPGHEAFTALRARGAQVTDIAILVIAADDGVMPQTIEAINHAKAANVPIIVAINKIDKPEANPDRVKQQLSGFGLIPEEWGGETIMVPVSAKRKQGIENLLEIILLVAEIQELRADSNTTPKGVIIETRIDKGKGPVGTVIVQEGTLKIGQYFVAGEVKGKIRTMFDAKNCPLKEALPSQPVEVSGFEGLPQAGDILQVVRDEKEVEEILEERRKKKETSNFEIIGLGEKTLPLIIKTDTQGSLEAILQAIGKMDSEEITIKVIHSGIGSITESDVMLASASKALIIGFNVRPDNKANEALVREKIQVKTYRIIYEIIADLENIIKGFKKPEIKEVIIGLADVKAIFNIPRIGTVAGVYVKEGKIQRNAKVRLLRDGKIIYDGRISSLKRFKEDVTEVLTNFECGVGLENFGDVKPGDQLEVYVLQNQ